MKTKENFRRIYILGSMGGGKTTLAKIISKKLNLPDYDLDNIFWKRKYDLKRGDKECKKLLDKIIKKDKWIIEGVYSRWVKSGVKRSQLVVWLDLPFKTIAYRLIKRKILREDGKYMENWRDTWRMVKQNYQYTQIKHNDSDKKDTYGYKLYKDHKSLLNKHKFVHIKNKKERNKFLEDI